MIIARANSEEVSVAKKDRTPIHTMEGLVSFPMAESEELIDMERNLKTAKRIITHMDSQVNELLEYTKITKGQKKPKKQAFLKEDLRKQIEFLLQPLCEDKALTYRLDFSGMEDCSFYTDKGMLVQIFWQLLDNAAQYTDEGGRISFEARTLEKTKKEITNCFIISDNGIGISEEFQKYLFQPFMRERNRMSDAVEGTGLGLYIVCHIVKMMKGGIQVESQKDKGTKVTITLTFPICNSAQGEKKGSAANVAALKGKRVILCEESPQNEAQTRKCLEKAGMLVEVAKDGYEVIELFRNSTPYYYDAILINVRMKVLNGLEVTNGIRCLDRNDAYLIPVIALIVGTYDENMPKPLAGGMDVQIKEPLEIRELADSLVEFWKKYKD